MRRTATAWTLLLALTACAAMADGYQEQRDSIMARLEALEANEDGQSESERLKTFIDLFFEYQINEHPEFGTFIGVPADHGRWTDDSFEAMERRDQDSIRGLEMFRTIDREQLEGEDRLNYDLILKSLEDGVKGLRFPGELLAINQMGGVQQNVAQLLVMMPTGNVAQYENILSRLAGVEHQVENTIARLEKGLAEGVTPPKVTLREVPQQVLNQLVEDPMASPMLRAFQKFPADVPEAEQERLRSAAVEIFSTRVKPAFEKLHTFLVETYLPATRESIAASALPDGQAWYAFMVEQMTTTDMTPQEIHELGLSEVKRIRAEMDRVIAESGFEGTFEEFTEFLRTDEQFYFAEAKDLLTAYRDIAKRADAELPKLFKTLPRLPYGVTPVPSYAEKSQTTAYYQPGSADAGRAGQFFANTYALETRPSWEMEALTLHEAVPGHHLQIAIAAELEDLPWFRRFGGETAFVEGWGLYAESLGGEMGFYEDPYSKFGQLTYEMWRAIRLVVDTGMHALGWSRQQAIDFFIQNTGKTEHDIIVEVDRYIVWPGQALAYKIGELKIKELKARAKEALGESFDIRLFHDVVLGAGALPLSVLEKRVDEWIAEHKTS